jgi:hypothetical protein
MNLFPWSNENTENYRSSYNNHLKTKLVNDLQTGGGDDYKCVIIYI